MNIFSLSLAEDVGIEPTLRFTSRTLGFQYRGLTSRPILHFLAECKGFEPLLRFLTGYGLASRPITTLATFQNYRDRLLDNWSHRHGIEPATSPIQKERSAI